MSFTHQTNSKTFLKLYHENKQVESKPKLLVKIKIFEHKIVSRFLSIINIVNSDLFVRVLPRRSFEWWNLECKHTFLGLLF